MVRRSIKVENFGVEMGMEMGRWEGGRGLMSGNQESWKGRRSEYCPRRISFVCEEY